MICLLLEISGLKIKLSPPWPIAWFLRGRREGECEVCEVELLWKGGNSPKYPLKKYMKMETRRKVKRARRNRKYK